MNININNLSKSYFLNDEKEVKVLENINFSIKSSEMVVITGVSGVGKSTLLHLLGTLDEPTKGSITYDNENIFLKNESEIAEFRNKNIGYVFQFHHLLSEFSALENVMMPLYMARIPNEKAQILAKEVLDFVSLSHRYDHKPGELSGGEQQRVALARALVTKPQVLLADEPTGNLDETSGKDIIYLIKKYNEIFKTTVILITHNTSITNLFDTRLVLTKNGIILNP